MTVKPIPFDLTEGDVVTELQFRNDVLEGRHPSSKKINVKQAKKAMADLKAMWGDTRAVYYIFKWELPGKVDLHRAETAGGSVMYDWNELEFKETNKGGRRIVLRRPTALLAEFEMHVTTLNEGITSHDPHTHPAEEIILVKSGFVEEIIDDKAYKAGPGSLIFLGLQSNHGIKNIGIKFHRSTHVKPMDKLDLMGQVMKHIDSSISV